MSAARLDGGVTYLIIKYRIFQLTRRLFSSSEVYLQFTLHRSTGKFQHVKSAKVLAGNYRVLSYEAEVRRVTTSTGGSSIVRPPQFCTDDNKVLCILYVFTLAVVVYNLVMPVLEYHILQAVCAPYVQHTI